MRRYTVKVNDKEKVIDVEAVGANVFRVKVDGRYVTVSLDDHRDLAHASPITPSIQTRGAAQPTSQAPTRASARAAEARPDAKPGDKARDKLTAPMPGVILSIDVAVGARVKRGDPLMVLEAMKMKNELKAPRDGRVAEIYVKADQTVKYGEFLLRFEG